MKHCFIAGLICFLCNSVYSQQLTRHLGDSVYVVKNTAVKDSISVPVVRLRLDTACYHEHTSDNSSVAVFRMVNRTDQVIFIPKELICWDDSGFSQQEYFSPDRQFAVSPGKSAEVTVQIRGTRKSVWSKSGTFSIFSKQGESYRIQIWLSLVLTPEKCTGN